MIINQFKPAFYDDFRCTGGDCKYTCCQEWHINIGKNSYFAIKKAKLSKTMREKVQSCYKRNKMPESDEQYGYLQLNDDGFCPLLNEQGMCSLQFESGYEVLLSTCKDFPRIGTFTPTGVERCLSIGCEAVVKLLIDQRNGIEFKQDKCDAASMHSIEHVFLADKFATMPIAAYYWDMKALGLMILQCQAHSLDDRMLLLGIAMQELDKMAAEGRLPEIPSYVDRMIAGIDTIKMDEIFADVEIDRIVSLEKELQALLSVCRETQDFTTRVLDGLGYTLGEADAENKMSVSNDMNTYHKARERLAQFEAKHPRAMENIMVSEFHRRAIPLSSDFAIWDSYIQFVYEYIFIKLTAAGYLDDNISEDDFIHAVVMIARRYGHSPDAAEIMVDKTKEEEIATLGYLAIMIKG